MFTVTFNECVQGEYVTREAALLSALLTALDADGYDGPVTVSGPEGFTATFSPQSRGHDVCVSVSK